MKSKEWKTYRTRFLVKARKLSSNLTFVDGLGRQHSGRKGDYLVESSEGVISIAPRQIFEDIYVAMGLEENVQQENAHEGNFRRDVKQQPVRAMMANESGPWSRKQPQPCRRRPASSAIGLG
jgi:hypothetical protein